MREGLYPGEPESDGGEGVLYLSLCLSPLFLPLLFHPCFPLRRRVL